MHTCFSENCILYFSEATSGILCSSVVTPPAQGHETSRTCTKWATHWICSKWNPSTYSWNKSYEQEQHELQWLTVIQRHHLLSLCQVYKTVNRLDCIKFSDYFSYSKRSVRNCHSLQLPFTSSRINAFRYSFFVNSPFLWNKLPSSVVCSTSLPSFKHQLFYHIMSCN